MLATDATRSYRRRAVHFASYAMFWLAVLHGARAGTDAAHPAYVAGVSGAVLVVVFLTAYRVIAVRKARRTSRSAPRPGGGRTPAALTAEGGANPG